ncbi:hypothetical protein EYF80_042912 [Liparis tanakae]|uniref:Uncharacterized protein n=1 Tax=Liparis tanakae TaxID=230148 RepID=A0A4Z2FZZ3_9TELE|nr:hypothetical protein EYF80_042912 [Liparis tanakae]
MSGSVYIWDMVQPHTPAPVAAVRSPAALLYSSGLASGEQQIFTRSPSDAPSFTLSVWEQLISIEQKRGSSHYTEATAAVCSRYGARRCSPLVLLASGTASGSARRRRCGDEQREHALDLIERIGVGKQHRRRSSGAAGCGLSPRKHFRWRKESQRKTRSTGCLRISAVRWEYPASRAYFRAQLLKLDLCAPVALRRLTRVKESFPVAIRLLVSKENIESVLRLHLPLRLAGAACQERDDVHPTWPKRDENSNIKAVREDCCRGRVANNISPRFLKYGRRDEYARQGSSFRCTEQPVERQIGTRRRRETSASPERQTVFTSF